MTKKKWMLLAAPFVAVLSFLGLTGYKYYGHGHNAEHHAQHVIERVTDYLELDEQQQAKLAAVRTEMLAAHENWRGERAALMDELIAQVRSGGIDEGAIYNLIEARKAMFDQLAPKVIASVVELHAALTPEQRAKAAEKLEKWRRHRGSREE